jgi:hypothetical protein
MFKSLSNGTKLFFNVLMRIVAAFTASALGVIGAGAVAHIPLVKAMAVAGITSVALVVEKLARGFMDDGKLSMDEINAAFSAIDSQAKTAADLQVEARQSGTSITINPDGTTTTSQGAAPVAVVPVADVAPAAPAEPAAPAAPAAPEDDPHYN